MGLLSSAFHLRARLARVLHLFRENAADLFPMVVQRQPIRTKYYRAQKRSRDPRGQNLQPDTNLILSLEALPGELGLLAQDFYTFLEQLDQIFLEIPEFTDDAVTSSAMNFHADLKYWVSCLGDFKGW